MSKINQRNHNILIVDDEEDIREVIEAYIETDNRTFFHAGNGKEAIKVLKDNDIDLVITDIAMPEMNGLDLCKHIHDSNHHISVIVLTAHGGKQEMHLALTYGVFDFLDKPVSKDVANNRVTNALKKHDVRVAEINLLEILCDALEIRQEIDFKSLSDEKRVEYLQMVGGLATLRLVKKS